MKPVDAQDRSRPGVQGIAQEGMDLHANPVDSEYQKFVRHLQDLHEREEVLRNDFNLRREDLERQRQLEIFNATAQKNEDTQAVEETYSLQIERIQKEHDQRRGILAEEERQRYSELKNDRPEAVKDPKAMTSPQQPMSETRSTEKVEDKFWKARKTGKEENMTMTANRPQVSARLPSLLSESSDNNSFAPAPANEDLAASDLGQPLREEGSLDGREGSLHRREGFSYAREGSLDEREGSLHGREDFLHEREGSQDGEESFDFRPAPSDAKVKTLRGTKRRRSGGDDSPDLPVAKRVNRRYLGPTDTPSGASSSSFDDRGARGRNRANRYVSEGKRLSYEATFISYDPGYPSRSQPTTWKARSDGPPITLKIVGDTLVPFNGVDSVVKGYPGFVINKSWAKGAFHDRTSMRFELFRARRSQDVEDEGLLKVFNELKAKKKGKEDEPCMLSSRLRIQFSSVKEFDDFLSNCADFIGQPENVVKESPDLGDLGDFEEEMKGSIGRTLAYHQEVIDGIVPSNLPPQFGSEN